MKRSLSCCLTLLCLASPVVAAPTSSGSLLEEIDIPYQRYVLSNGLTLVVHEDHKAPIVAVNVWYHVGSKNEKPGKTGFAHLFEHLMFNGSEHFDDDYFKALEKVGATDVNGTTSADRTDYFENAPKEALDMLLWLESDRMGYMVNAISQAKLDEQRGVVQNEKRQHENQPYGLVEQTILKNCYPAGHPYSWSVIGSMEDLNAASLDDVKNWFKEYYGAANATLVVAGDVDPETVRAKVEHFFGEIPSGGPVTHQKAWVAQRTGVRREVMQDRVPLARLYMVWNIPEYGTPAADYLDLVSDVLSMGKSSRLYKRLVYEDQVATDVSASVDMGEIGGRFIIEATARPGESLDGLEQAINEELSRFLEDGPTPAELQRVKTQSIAGFIRGIERIGGFGGKSDILAMNQTYMDQPDYYKVMLHRANDATGRQLQEAARQWLSDGVYVLQVVPFREPKIEATAVDRSRLPVPELEPEVRFPDLQRTTLANGLKVVLAERHAVPVVNFILQVNAGYAADQFTRPGNAKLAMDMLDEGTRNLSALEISDELDRLGATLRSGSDLDTSLVGLSALKGNLGPSLDLFADVVLHPAFPAEDFNRLKKLQLDAIQREKSEPLTMALRVLPGLLYGAGHAYSTPFTGSGTVESVSGITRADMGAFYQTWFKPNNATLIVVGDTTLEEIVPELERRFKDWQAGEVPQKNIGQVSPPSQPALYVIDRPASIQSVILAARVAPPQNNPQEIAIETMNNILGGTFTSRLNMDLREDKHWSYGVRTVLVPACGQRPYILLAPVQADKTKEAIAALEGDLSAILGDKPVTAEELARAQTDQTLKLAGRWETSRAVAGSVVDIVRFGYPDDYFTVYPEKVLALTRADVEQAARTVVRPEQLVWVVVGDRATLEPELRELGLGEVRTISAD